MNNWILPDVRDKESMDLDQQSIYSQFEDNLSPNYVLLDAALWGTDINILFLNENVIYKSLFRGSTGEKLWSVAPYLVDISSNEELVKKIKEKDPIERRVTWLSSPLSIDELRKHLRHFLRMRREDKSYIYFRFYDPFVVNAVFPNLNQEQCSEFFKEVDYLIADDIRINERHIFYLSSEKVLQIKHQTLDYVDNNR
ncbi:MAG: DUF4123 domain-containing protein [Dysgonomonas sp.]